MRVSSALAAFVVALAVACPSACVFAKDAEPTSAAPEKHLLRYKFAMGEVLRYDVRHATNVRTTIDESTQQALTQSDSVKAWKVTDVLPNGEMEFVHVVEWVRMSNEAPEQASNVYDSRTDKQPPRGFEQAARAVGVPLSVLRIAGDGEVTFREEKQPQPKSSEDMPITLRLPKERVAVGEKWNYPYDVPAERKDGSKLQVRTRRVCTLRQVKSGVAVIDVEYQILTPVDPFVRSQLIERLTQGTVRFDVERGRILEQEHNVDSRVLGFAGKASSMHFVARLQEKLLKPTEAVARAQHVSPATK
jgi:hypothetical protein